MPFWGCLVLGFCSSESPPAGPSASSEIDVLLERRGTPEYSVLFSHGLIPRRGRGCDLCCSWCLLQGPLSNDNYSEGCKSWRCLQGWVLFTMQAGSRPIQAVWETVTCVQWVLVLHHTLKLVA